MSIINKLSCGVSIHEEVADGKKVFVAECSELGLSDFGDNVSEALDNLKLAINCLVFSLEPSSAIINSKSFSVCTL